MKAVTCRKYGPPEVLKIEDLAKPEPKDDEILIKVHAAIVSPPDCAFRKAEPFIVRFFAGFFKPKNTVPGELFSGVVESIGKNVTRFKAGDEIFGSAGMSLGAYAEYVCVKETEMLVEKPQQISHAEAAGIGDGPITALPFLRDSAKLEKGQRVLINGASGSVGIAAVQVAKYLGAHVTGVCSSANVEMVKGLGADSVIDYTKEKFTSSEKKWDVIFDVVGKSSFSQCRDVLTDNGIYMTTIPDFGVMVRMMLSSKKSGKRAAFSATGMRKAEDKTKDTIFLRDLVVEGKIKVVTDKVWPMKEIVEAHAYVESGHKKGNVVIDIEGEEK